MGAVSPRARSERESVPTVLDAVYTYKDTSHIHMHMLMRYLFMMHTG